jgi:tryptophan 2,3-dioxygenase
MMRPHAHVPGMYAKLEAELNEPSLYDEAIRLAARRGIAMPEAVISRDVRQTHALHDEG